MEIVGKRCCFAWNKTALSSQRILRILMGDISIAFGTRGSRCRKLDNEIDVKAELTFTPELQEAFRKC